MDLRKVYLLSIIGLVLNINSFVGCRTTKTEVLSEPSVISDQEPTILFINLRFFNPKNNQAEILKVIHSKGTLKQAPEKEVDVPLNGYRCSFVDKNGQIYGQYSIVSPLEEYMEKVNQDGSLEKVLVKKEEAFIPLRITDDGKITHLLIEQNINGNFMEFAKFDLTAKH
ncbi:MAG TPA: hypothetical protein PLY70_07670 [Saprospiraceae bacterium]|nr:hypothetical protein [Saprospiraceae bacterium]HPN69360.1 hypothetical protein [Saprospiraceae bacterium]